MKAVKVLKRFFFKHSPRSIINDLTNHPIKQYEKMITLNKSRFEWLKKNLNDNFSKDVLNQVILYRKTGEFEFLNQIADITLNQYFDKCLQFSDNEVFIDCGGFIGDTTQNFILRHPNFQQIFLYEPIPQHFNVCKNTLSQHSNVILKNCGVGNENKTVHMTELGGCSLINKKGDIPCKIIRLDEDLQNIHPTFVKMDLEGYEMEALKGMTRILKEDKPKLAICVYHKPMDILEIPEFIKSINPNYKLSLRQYIFNTRCSSELVLYAY